MEPDCALTFFHAPNSRSAGVRVLLEELAAPYEVSPVNFKSNQQKSAEFLAINPMGKVPTIRHGEAVITEQVAIFLYLGDAFAKAGLAPAIDDPLRGPYLRWTAFYGSCFEPAVVDRALKRDPAPQATSPYGDFATTLSTIVNQLQRGPYLLGQTMYAADVLWATALGWITRFGLVPADEVISAYIERIASRPAALRAKELDAKLAEQLAS
jgi:glutathione S-transferase